MSQTSLLRLMTLLSPSFPVGGFAYSAGLEQAVADELISDVHSLNDWLTTLLQTGPTWNDAVLLCAAHWQFNAPDDLAETAALAAALAGSKERHMETLSLGGAFVEAVKASGLPCPDLPPQLAYPVAVGAVAGANGIEPQAAAAAFIHGFISNQIQCAIRLGVLGQNAGVAMLASFEVSILETAHRASHSTFDDLGSCTLIADISAMRHEGLYSRIFRT
jgi:urease accessory protein